MQFSIQIPDNLPIHRVKQRIRELEDSLREEAKFISDLNAGAQAHHSEHTLVHQGSNSIRDVGGSLKEYARTYTPLSEVREHARQEYLNEYTSSR